MKPEVPQLFPKGTSFNMSTNTEEEVEKLTQEGHQQLADGDLDGACSAFERATTLASHLREGFIERACFFNLGACYVARGDAKRGIEYLKKALPPDKDSDGTANFADLQYNLGLAYDALNQLELAIKCYEQAKCEYEAQNNREMQGETLIKLAVDSVAIGKLRNAADFYLEAGNVYESLKDKKKQVLSLNSRASVLGELQDIDKCAETLRMVVDLCEDLSDTTLKGKVYNDLGLLYNSLKSYDNAAECFEIAIPLVTTSGQDEELEAVLHQNLGAVYNQLRKYEEGIKYHSHAIELHGKLGNRTTQGQTFCNLGFAQSQLGNFEEAAESFLHAVQASKDGHDKKSHWQALEGLAATYFLQGSYTKAVENYKSALFILTTSGESAVEHNDRIVKKLADAMECQLKFGDSPKRNNKSRRSTRKKKSPRHGKDIADKGTRKSKRVGRTRERQGNHKLIARGIQGDDDDDESESCTHSEDSSESDSDSGRYIEPSWEHRQKQGSAEEIKTLQLSGPYQKLVKDDNRNDYEEADAGAQHRKRDDDHSTTKPRAHREAYLASIAASNHDEPSQSSSPDKTTYSKNQQSKTCVLQ